MKLIFTIALFLLLSGCANDDSDGFDCADFEALIDDAEQRIKLISVELTIEDNYRKNRRLPAIQKHASRIGDNFTVLKTNLSINNDYQEQIDNIIEELQFLTTMLDANLNLVSDNIIAKKDYCVKTLYSLVHLSETGCIEFDLYKIAIAKENVFNLISIISNTDKFLFDKTETWVVPTRTNGLEVATGDSIGIVVGLMAYDSMQPQKLRYWIDDSSKNGDCFFALGYSPKIYFMGDKGRHKVYGDYQIRVNGRYVWKPWQFEYEVK